MYKWDRNTRREREKTVEKAIKAIAHQWHQNIQAFTVLAKEQVNIGGMRTWKNSRKKAKSNVDQRAKRYSHSTNNK
jgi:hypothetical protein